MCFYTRTRKNETTTRNEGGRGKFPALHLPSTCPVLSCPVLFRRRPRPHTQTRARTRTQLSGGRCEGSSDR